MKIYFAGSITAGREDVDVYSEIVELLKEYGEVLTEHVADKNLSQMGEEISDKKIFDRDMQWIEQSDLVVAEVSHPSFGVGMEILKASNLRKKIICFYRPIEGKRLSRMVLGCPGVLVFEYENIDQLKSFLDKEI